MARALRYRFGAAVAGCAFVLACVTAAHARQDPRTHPEIRTEESACLYIFNDSGPTLFSAKQKVQDAGRTIVDLPRHTYQRVTIASGPHDLRLTHLRKPRVRFDAEPGKTYYVVVAYRPERGQVWPFAGSPYVLKMISEEEAQPLLAAMNDVATKP